MQKHIVIISFLFPPYNNVAARRVYYYAKYLKKRNYKITIITTSPDNNIYPDKSWIEDLSMFNMVYINILKYPSSYNLLQKLLARIYFNSTGIINRIVRNICFFILPLDFGFRWEINYRTLAEKVDKVDFIFATGGPWSIFEFASKLKSLVHCKLIFDYRDSWHVYFKQMYIHSLHYYGSGIFASLKRYWMRTLEKKYMKFADGFTAASKYMVKNVQSVDKKKQGIELYNGFDHFETSIDTKSDRIKILYLAILLKEQTAKIFVDGLLEFNREYPSSGNKLEIIFIGISGDGLPNLLNAIDQHPKLKKLITLLPAPIDFNIIKSFMASSNYFLLFNYEGSPGNIPYKVFDFFAFKKPIIYTSSEPNDLEDILLETDSGIICKNKYEFKNTLKKIIEGDNLSYNCTFKNIEKYMYSNQIENLDLFFKKIEKIEE